MGSLLYLLNHYGYIVLFISLLLELIALPLPGELLMTYCGFLVFENRLNWIISIVVAALGTISGITLSYFIGRTLENKLFKKYGAVFHISEERIEVVSNWFNQYGNKLLVVTYYIPGVRHITGYFSGATKIKYKKFAFFAYIGALIWSTIFITLGKLLGPEWRNFHVFIKKYTITISVIVILTLVIVYLIKKYINDIQESIYNSLAYVINIYNSLGKIRVLIVIVTVTFFSLIVLEIKLIEDFLEQEFNALNANTSLLIEKIFKDNWTDKMYMFRQLNSIPIIFIVVLLILGWIIAKGTDRVLETKFLLLIIVEGYTLQFILGNIFGRLRPEVINNVTNYSSTFLNKNTLLSVTVYGYLIFIVLRHSENKWLRRSISLIAILSCLISGIGSIYLRYEYPSDLIEAYVLGGILLSLNIILLEVFRILPTIKKVP